MATPLLSRVGLDGLGGRRLFVLAEKTAAGFGRDRCTLAAAAIAYHALLSLFPLAIVLTWVATWFIDDQDAIAEVVELITDQVSLTPSATADLESQLERAISASRPAGLIGLAVLVWTASSLITAVRRSVNLAWSTEVARFFVVGKLIDIAVVTLLGVLIGASILLSLARSLLPDGVENLLGPAMGLSPLLVGFLALLLTYRFLPAVRTYVRDIWPAALAAALAFELLKFGFQIYLDAFSNNDLIYGSLAAVIGFMVFIYLAANVLLAGAELASELPRVRSGLYDGAPGETGGSLRDRIASKLRRATDGKPDEPFRRRSRGRNATPPDG